MVAFPILLPVLVGSPAHPSARIVAPIQYQVDYARPGDSQVRVTLRLPTPLPRAAQFVMPRAIPMGYGTQPYDRFVSDLAAFDPAGRPIRLTDLDGPRWLVESGPNLPVATISYRVDLARMDQQILSAGDASRARPRFLGLLGYSVFGFIDGFEDAPVVLTVRVPAEWPVVLTLAPLGDSLGTATVAARDYYALADAQILAGPDLVVRRLDAGVPLTFATYAEGAVELDTIAALAGQALRQAIRYFGSAPFPHFTVALEVLQPVSPDHGYRFSMEHLESATFRFATGQIDLSPEGRDRFHYNLLHHVAHAWIPKRCAPAGYYPFTWDYAAPIDAIWFSEGWAQYAAADIFARDRPDADRVLRAWAGRRFDQAAADSAPPIAGRGTALLSTIAAHQYSDDFRISQTVFARGGKMAEAIDQRIRARTAGTKTFRDVARALLAWCATADEPVTTETLERVVHQSTGVATRDLIDHWLAARGPTLRHRPRP